MAVSKTITYPATREFFQEFFTSYGAEPVEDKRLHSAALIRLIVIVPLVFAFTYFALARFKDYGYHPVLDSIFVLWAAMTFLYIATNLILCLSPRFNTGYERALSYFCIFLELGTNQLILYTLGSLVSHVTLYIVLIVAVYRVFFDFRFSLFAALLGGAIFTLVGILELTGTIPLSPLLPEPVNHPIYTDTAFLPAATAVIQGVLIGIFVAFFSINYGMNQALKLYRKLQEQSLMDGLTGLANRRRFDEYLGVEWGRARRLKKTLSLIMIDLDAFKAFNDNYGHLAGDDCLRKVAMALKEGLKRPADLAARYGGEEFAVILPDTGKQGALALAEELRDRVEALKIPHAYSPVAQNVTVSLGVATLVPAKEESPDPLIEHADQALYQAKEKGRNRVEVAQ